jgi:hypothetical protein
MPSKIKKELTPEQVVELLHTLASTPGGDVLRVIQAAAKKRGIQVSLMGASAFRDEELKPYLDKLKFARAKSQALAEAVTAGDEAGLLAASRTMLAEKISDVLMADGEELPHKALGGLSKALQQLTSANTGSSMAAARLREFEAKEEERKAAAAALEKRKADLTKKGGLSEEAIRLIEDTVKILS